MKKMFIFVAIVGLAFASCKKEELVTTESAKSGISKPTDNWVRTSKKVIEVDGVYYHEYTNSLSGQNVYCEVPGQDLKAPKYDKKAAYVKVPGEDWYRWVCEEPGDNCYNRATIGPGGLYVEVFLKDDMK